MAVLLVTVSHLKFTPAEEEQIRALVTQHEVVFARDRQDVAAIAAQVEIVVGSAELDLVAESSGLRWIQLWSTGADSVWECPGLPEREIQVTNLRGVHAVPISEHVFALLLARIRNIPHLALNQSERKWQNPKELTFQELKGGTMVVLGTGTVGQAVVRIAQGFGLYTVGIRRQGQGPLRSFDEVHSGSHLRQALKRADFVVVTLPLTTATKGLIGIFEFRAMPAHAFLISVGRGAVIDEGALVTALRSQWVAGGGPGCIHRRTVAGNLSVVGLAERHHHPSQCRRRRGQRGTLHGGLGPQLQVVLQRTEIAESGGSEGGILVAATVRFKDLESC